MTARGRAPWLFLGLAIAAVPRTAGGGGFAIDQGGRGVGHAFVGEAALAEDAVTLYYNPAGATRLPGATLSLGGQFILFKAQFEDHGSTLNPAVGGGPLRGDHEANGGEIGMAPAGFFVQQLSDRIWAGLAVSIPFGLATEYDSGWVGRYHALGSQLKTVDVAPTVAVKLIDGLSLGAGFDIQYVYAKLSSNLDLGGLCALNARQFGQPPSACGLIGLAPQSADGFVRLRADSWGLGYNLGLLWEQTSRTRVGVSYRSQVDHTLEGDADFSIPKRARILRTLSGALIDTGGSADVSFPDTVRLAVYHDLTPRWAVMTGIDWTDWSHFEELVFNFDNPAQPPLQQTERFHDTIRTGLAVIYRPTERWRLRAGFQYDETPVPNPVRRTPRIPDHDRYWVSLGGSLDLTERLVADVGYMHIFARSARIENADPLTGHVLRGSFSGGGDVFGAQVTWRFH